MRRRDFIAGLGSRRRGPLVARAQQADRVPHFGALMNGVPGDSFLPVRLLSEQMTSAAASVCESNRARGSLRTCRLRWAICNIRSIRSPQS
jgi:hypothetical protein